jgi:hypothetical protein
MATEADERRWREAMEGLGTETVRAKLAQAGVGTRDDVAQIVGQLPFPTRKFVETWLAQKEAVERRRRDRVEGFTLAFAGIAAAAALALLALALSHRL